MKGIQITATISADVRDWLNSKVNATGSIRTFSASVSDVLEKARQEEEEKKDKKHGANRNNNVE